MPTRLPHLRRCSRRAVTDAWESRSLPGTLAGLAAVAIAATILYVFSAKQDRGGIVLGVVATVLATILVVVSVFLWHLARAPGKLHGALSDENAQLREQLADLRGLGDRIEIEARPSQKWGDQAFYLQHIHIKNRGPVATFMVTVDTHFVGLEDDWGIGYEVPWEHPHAAEKRLGKDQHGALHFLGSERNEEGRIEVWAFSIPEPRHHGVPGYLPTTRYRVAADAEAVTFTLCVRNVDTDATHRRLCRLTFAEDGKPTLELDEVADAKQ
jgi:hypothetical protein